MFQIFQGQNSGLSLAKALAARKARLTTVIVSANIDENKLSAVPTHRHEARQPASRRQWRPARLGNFVWYSSWHHLVWSPRLQVRFLLWYNTLHVGYEYYTQWLCEITTRQPTRTNKPIVETCKGETRLLYWRLILVRCKGVCVL